MTSNINDRSELFVFLNVDDNNELGLINNNISIDPNMNYLSSNNEYGFKKLATTGNFKLIKMFKDNFIIGESVDQDMYDNIYTTGFNPADYPQYFPGMNPFIDANIVAGDKPESSRLTASLWYDWGNDVFDSWGHFYLYDVELGQYYFPLISPQNQYEGVFASQTFNAFNRTFTITHGYPDQGIFKFDISVNDDKPFKFGAYGNMGSDGTQLISNLIYPYKKLSHNLTLFYVKQQEEDNEQEIIYSYFIPKKVSENNDQTYNLYQDEGSADNSLMSKEVTKGLIVYFSKTNDVKEWVARNLPINIL